MKHKIIVFVLIFVLLAACGGAQPAEQAAEPTDIPATEPPPATDTPIPPPPTETPQPGPELVFEDDFEGEFGEGWSWVREEKNRWSLTEAPGYLQILLQPYGLGGGYPHNMLTREAPDYDFEIETLLVFEPRSNYQIAGLLLYQDEYNAVQFGRAFCGNPNCVGNGLYYDNFIEGNFTGDNFAINIDNPSEVYLKVRRQGTIYTALYSEDGENWIEMGAHDNMMALSSIGLIAGQSYEPAVLAKFDYFRLYQLP